MNDRRGGGKGPEGRDGSPGDEGAGEDGHDAVLQKLALTLFPFVLVLLFLLLEWWLRGRS